jgi:hypothetical protein
VKLILHLLSADIRRFRLMIGLWLAISVASTALEGVRPLFASYVFSMNPIGVAGDLIWLAKVLVGFVLIPLVVHTHPLVGSDVFWMTRPIPPRALMASKLTLLVAMIVLVPVACEMALMIAYKVPPQRMAAVAVQTTLWQVLYLTIVMALAALTRNLARFALLFGGLLLGLAVTAMITAAIAMSRMDDSAAVMMVAVSVGPPAPNVDDATSGIVFLLVVVATGLALLMVQYATRSSRRSAVVGVAGLVVAWALSSMWPWPLLQRRVIVPDWATNESSLMLSADSDSVEFGTEDLWTTRKPTWRIGRAQVRLEGIEPGWLPSVRMTGAVLDLQPNVHLSSSGFGYAVQVPIGSENNSPLRGVVRAALGVTRLAIQDSSEPQCAPVVAIRDADFTRYAPGIGRYRGSAAVELTREEVVATLPLQAGATFQEDAHRVVLDEVRLASKGLIVRARISDARTAFDRRPTPRYALYLRNQQRGEAVGSSIAPMQSHGLLTGLLPGPAYGFEPASGSSGFAMGGQFILFPPRYALTDKERLDIDERWIAGAEIVIVRETAEGSVSRPLEIRDFSLPSKPVSLDRLARRVSPGRTASRPGSR